jgi:hypothetical protein
MSTYSLIIRRLYSSQGLELEFGARATPSGRLRLSDHAKDSKGSAAVFENLNLGKLIRSLLEEIADPRHRETKLQSTTIGLNRHFHERTELHTGQLFVCTSALIDLFAPFVGTEAQRVLFVDFLNIYLPK